MPHQIFRIDRAPEAKPLNSREIRRWLWWYRTDTDWQVMEVEIKEVENADRN